MRHEIRVAEAVLDALLAAPVGRPLGDSLAAALRRGRKSEPNVAAAINPKTMGERCVNAGEDSDLGGAGVMFT